MKNEYATQGEHTIIFLQTIQGEKIKTVISISDLDRANEFPNTWYASKSPHKDMYYVAGKMKVDGRRKTICFTRWLLKITDPTVEVDHWNNDTLNNTRDNLRKLSHAENLQNKTLYKNNKTGITGISFNEQKNRYRARLMVGQCVIMDKLFKTLTEAYNRLDEKRRVHMPYSIKPERGKGKCSL